MPLYGEIEGRRWSENRYGTLWRGERVFACYAPDAPSVQAALNGTPFGGGVDATCTASIARYQRAGATDLAIVTARYGFPTGRLRLVRRVNRAVIETRPIVVQMMRLADLAGNPISATTGDGGQVYKSLNGETYPYARMEIKIGTAFKAGTVGINLLLDKMFMCNIGPWANIGAPEETLLYVGAITRRIYGDELVLVTYVFHYDRQGWRKNYRVVKGVMMMQKKPVFDEDNNFAYELPSIEFRPGNIDGEGSGRTFVEGNYNAEGDFVEDRAVVEPTDFGEFSGMAIWT